MLTDRENMFSVADPVLGVDKASTDSVFVGANRDLGRGEPLRVFANVETTFASGTSLDVQLVESNDPTLATGRTILASTGAIVTANLTRGTRVLDVPMPATKLAYVGFWFDVTGTMTAGTITGGIVAQSESGLAAGQRYLGETGRGA